MNYFITLVLLSKNSITEIEFVNNIWDNTEYTYKYDCVKFSTLGCLQSNFVLQKVVLVSVYSCQKNYFYVTVTMHLTEPLVVWLIVEFFLIENIEKKNTHQILKFILYLQD